MVAAEPPQRQRTERNILKLALWGGGMPLFGCLFWNMIGNKVSGIRQVELGSAPRGCGRSSKRPQFPIGEGVDDLDFGLSWALDISRPLNRSRRKALFWLGFYHEMGILCYMMKHTVNMPYRNIMHSISIPSVSFNLQHPSKMCHIWFKYEMPTMWDAIHG